MIHISTPGGQTIQSRAIIDPGSEASFAEASLIQRLGATFQETDISVHGIGGQPSEFCKRKAVLEIITHEGPLNVTFYILPCLGIRTPRKHSSNNGGESYFPDLDLADANFLEPGKVETLLGADVYALILRPGVKSLNQVALVAQQTLTSSSESDLGLVVSRRRR